MHTLSQRTSECCPFCNLVTASVLVCFTLYPYRSRSARDNSAHPFQASRGLLERAGQSNLHRGLAHLRERRMRGFRVEIFAKTAEEIAAQAILQTEQQLRLSIYLYRLLAREVDTTLVCS